MIIDGKAIAEAVRQEVKMGVERLRGEKGITPGLAVVLVGENPASLIYVRQKEKACSEVGVNSLKHSLKEDISQSELLDLIGELNSKPEVQGILVQLPLPEHLNEAEVISAINPAKDVDGLHPLSLGRLLRGEAALTPCTPQGVIELITRSGFEIKGKEAVVVGRSNMVGKPVALLLLQHHATVTICHSRTADLEAETRRADILVAAVGSPHLIKAGMVKEGAVVIDVGTNRVDNKLLGDVDFEGVKDKVAAITPVPGGVGPMTVAMLLKNTLMAAQRQV